MVKEQRKNRVVYCGKGGEKLKVSLDSLDEEIKKALEEEVEQMKGELLC